MSHSAKEQNDDEGVGWPGFIRDRKPNLELWAEVQTLAVGNNESQRQAIKILIRRNRDLPDAADDLLVKLSSEGEPEIRNAVASELIDVDVFSWSLAVRVIQAIRDNGGQIDKTLEPKYGSLLKQIDDFTNSAQQLSSAILKPFLRHQELQKTATEMARQFSESVRKYFWSASISNRISSQLLSYLNSSSSSYGSFVASINRQLPSYFDQVTLASGDQITHTPDDEAGVHELITDLRNIPSGHGDWYDYQQKSYEILTECLVPPLLEPMFEDSTVDGLHRRDAIFQIPLGISGFWQNIGFRFSSAGVIVDAKNHKSLPKDQVVINSKYLGEKKLGNFGIITTRNKTGPSVAHEQKDRWVHKGEMIICLSDDDLGKMLTMKDADDEPTVIIDRKIFEVLSGV